MTHTTPNLHSSFDRQPDNSTSLDSEGYVSRTKTSTNSDPEDCASVAALRPEWGSIYPLYLFFYLFPLRLPYMLS